MCTQILVQYDLNLGGGSVPPHLPPTEPGSVPTKCIMKQSPLKSRFEQALWTYKDTMKQIWCQSVEILWPHMILRCSAADLICYSICEHRSKKGRNTKWGKPIHIDVCATKTTKQMFYLWYARPMIEHAFRYRYILGRIIPIFCCKIYHLGVNMVMDANIFTFLSWCPVMACRYIPRYNLNWLLEPTWSFISESRLFSFLFRSQQKKKVY